MATITFYSPTFLDESMTRPDRKGVQTPTGKLSGMLITRRFSKRGKKISATRGLVSFSWDEDTEEAKIAALSKAIKGMDELPDLDNNPPINWVPATVKERLA